MTDHPAADSERTEQELTALRGRIARHDSAVVAFSAGVDSTLVLKVAVDVLGPRALGVMGLSPSVPPTERADAESLSSRLGLPMVFVSTAEMQDPDYVANPPNRCFYCKQELYSVCQRVAEERGFAAILNGTNADDTSDWRPGLEAARRASVHAPLLEAGLGKASVRRLARHLGLPNHDKPAAACLASRLPYGTTVTAPRLAAVDAVEQHLRRLGFRQVRARHHGAEVRLEVDPERVGSLRQALVGEEFRSVLEAAGFSRATVAPDGYRMGRLNDDLT
jgi:uncharacterized protein